MHTFFLLRRSDLPKFILDGVQFNPPPVVCLFLESNGKTQKKGWLAGTGSISIQQCVAERPRKYFHLFDSIKIYIYCNMSRFQTWFFKNKTSVRLRVLSTRIMDGSKVQYQFWLGLTSCFPRFSTFNLFNFQSFQLSNAAPPKPPNRGTAYLW